MTFVYGWIGTTFCVCFFHSAFDHRHNHLTYNDVTHVKFSCQSLIDNLIRLSKMDVDV